MELDATHFKLKTLNNISFYSKLACFCHGNLSFMSTKKHFMDKLLNHIGNSLKIQPSLQSPLYHIMSLHYLPSITLFLTVYLQPNKELFCKVPFTTFVSLL